MARYLHAALGREHESQIVELSDSDDYSVSDDAPTQRDLNNRRLAQAINYINEEGGDDSGTTFMDRVGRINDTLLQQLPQQGRGAYDPELYQTVRAMVQDVQRDYENSRRRQSTPMYMDDDSQQYATPSFDEEALYRGDSDTEILPSSPTPAAGPSVPPKPVTGPPAMPSPRPLGMRNQFSDDNVERQRTYKYGGPDNEVEKWHRSYPPSLPFPETIKMAHWESLKIDYDLSRPKEDTVVETDVPFNHPQLLQYKNLPQYESGSRFKLPAVNEYSQEKVDEAGDIQASINAFNKSDQAEGVKKDYAPRVALEKFKLGSQCK